MSLDFHFLMVWGFCHRTGQIMFYLFVHCCCGTTTSGGRVVKLLACGARGPGFDSLPRHLNFQRLVISCFQVAIWLKYHWKRRTYSIQPTDQPTNTTIRTQGRLLMSIMVHLKLKARLDDGRRHFLASYTRHCSFRYWVSPSSKWRKGTLIFKTTQPYLTPV